MMTLLLTMCLTTGFANMNDEPQQPADAPSSQDEKENLNEDQSEKVSGTQTLGGRQFWGDLRFFHGFRIQKNVLTSHHRLLNPKDQRVVSGTLEECQEKLEEIRVQQKLPEMSGKAVILIHGIGRSSKCFAGMAKELSNDDYTVIGFDYPSTRIPIPDSAEYLHSVLKSLDKIDSVDVVVHSMGGLLLRSYLSNYKEPRFRRAVMLGVPNKGAKMADFLKGNPLFKAIMGPAGQQLVSGKDGLIEKLPTPKFEFAVLAGGRSAERGYNPLLPGDNDSTVTVESTRLPGARDFLLLPVIHSFLMSDKAAVAATRCFLRSGQFDTKVPAQPIEGNSQPAG